MQPRVGLVQAGRQPRSSGTTQVERRTADLHVPPGGQPRLFIHLQNPIGGNGEQSIGAVPAGYGEQRLPADSERQRLSTCIAGGDGNVQGFGRKLHLDRGVDGRRERAGKGPCMEDSLGRLTVGKNRGFEFAGTELEQQTFG